MKRYLLSIILISLLVFLTGCENRSRLYSDLSESSANDILAELASHDIKASREPSEEGVAISVASDDIQRAVNTLNAAGLPRKDRTDLGRMFEKDGIISTPFAEKARYIYSLSQELESTLTEIDGVITARVQVVLPDRVAPGEPVQPASASVFIKHSSALDPDVIRSRVRELVAGSIPGMAAQSDAENGARLSVVFVPAVAYHPEAPGTESLGPFMVSGDHAGLWKSGIFGVLFMMAIAVAGSVWWRYRRKAGAPSSHHSEGAGENAVSASDVASGGSIADILGLQGQATNDHEGEEKHDNDDAHDTHYGHTLRS